MCGGGGPGPAPVAASPAPIQPRQPDLIRQSQLPGKKELIDPEDVANVEYGTGEGEKNKPVKGQAKRQGTDALKINLQTPGGENTGGVSNV